MFHPHTGILGTSATAVAHVMQDGVAALPPGATHATGVPTLQAQVNGAEDQFPTNHGSIEQEVEYVRNRVLKKEDDSI
uniref:Uncharacterized protein n=1 Tax=Romanomermis culicivorax TaxID=13658 RepID=A0A915IIH3_ROMCU